MLSKRNCAISGIISCRESNEYNHLQLSEQRFFRRTYNPCYDGAGQQGYFKANSSVVERQRSRISIGRICGYE